MSEIRICLFPVEGEAGTGLTRKHILDELERISNRLGRNFTLKSQSPFVFEEEGKLFFVAQSGDLHQDKWKFIPRYGTGGEPLDGPAAFALFFWLATGLPFAKHHIEWTDFAWECFEDFVGAIIEAFRGSGKSVWARTLVAYLIGRYPSQSSVVLRAADGVAKQTSESIADIISNNPVWDLWFPKIEPKSNPGQSGGKWSASAGYNVVDMSRDPEEWARIEAARSSPTLTKFGMGSENILGSRVNLILLADDIHDEKNSDSPALLEEVITRFQGVAEKGRTPQSRLVIIGTPWGINDLLQQLPRTGAYRKIKTPVTLEGTYPGTPTWPEFYDEKWIDQEYNKDLKAGKIDFKRNQLLDLQAKIALSLSWEEYSHRNIKDWWPIRMGIDFAELEEAASGKGRSYFSLAVTTQEPASGSWIVIDGFLGQILQEQADNVLNGLLTKYGGVDKDTGEILRGRIEVICIEDIGGGAVYTQWVKRQHKKMPVVGEKGGGVPKEVRWERMLAPHFGLRRILVSDQKEHPFLDSVRAALKAYPNINKRGDWSADVFDSLVWAHYHAFMETGDPIRRRKKGEKKENPWIKLSKM